IHVNDAIVGIVRNKDRRIVDSGRRSSLPVCAETPAIADCAFPGEVTQDGEHPVCIISVVGAVGSDCVDCCGVDVVRVGYIEVCDRPRALRIDTPLLAGRAALQSQQISRAPCKINAPSTVCVAFAWNVSVSAADTVLIRLLNVVLPEML